MDPILARLANIEESLSSTHHKVDIIVQNEEWLSRLRRRLDQYRIVCDDQSDSDVLGAIGQLVYVRCAARLNATRATLR